MLLWFLAYIGGILTILSPCILPVLPFVFARSDQPFRRTGLPLLAGMAVTFALVASLATVGGGWVVRANQFGRIAALVLFGFFGLTLLFSSLAERLTRPFVQLGNRFSPVSGAGPSIANSFLLGVGTGLLWAPCAEPILGLILTGAALTGASANTVLLLLAYAAGAATSLAIALLAGARVFAAMKRSLVAEEWIRRGLGVAILLGVVAVALGLDRGVLTQLSLVSRAGFEQKILDRLRPGRQPDGGAMMRASALGAAAAGSFQRMPDISGSGPWINSPAVTPGSLHGKVVLVDFWTFACINCLRTLLYLKAWNAKYKDSGLVIIGVHTPEFPFEKDEANVRKAVQDLGITYPVVMDNDYRVWRAFDNQYWPAHYFVDANGNIRFHHFGEGGYDESETRIRDLLQEANQQQKLPEIATEINGNGAEAPSDSNLVESPETYIGYDRAENFASPGGFKPDAPRVYKLPQNSRTISGLSTVAGTMAHRLSRCSLRAAASIIAFMPAIFISCSGLPKMESRFAFA